MQMINLICIIFFIVHLTVVVYYEYVYVGAYSTF